MRREAEGERLESGGGGRFKACSEGGSRSIVGCPSTGGAVRASVVVSRDSICNARTWVDVPTISHQGFEGDVSCSRAPV